MDLTKEQKDSLSRVRNAARDTGNAYRNMERGIERLQKSIKECREAGLPEWRVENMIMDAANGNTAVIEFLEKLAKI